MDEIETRAITNTANPPKVWNRYVDDIYIMKKDSVSTFHDELNSIDPRISFNIEHENEDILPFHTLGFHTILAPLQLTSTANLYIHTNRYLDFKSHHDRKHKISTVATLLYRATRTPNTVEGKDIETKKVFEA